MNGAELSGALGALLPDRRQGGALKAATPAPGVAAFSRAAAITASSQGGIASPLVETDYSLRTHHAGVVLTSADGLFALTLLPVKDIRLVDANGQAVTLSLAAPA